MISTHPKIQQTLASTASALFRMQQIAVRLFQHRYALHVFCTLAVVYFFILPPPDPFNWQGLQAHKQVGTMWRGQGFLGDVLADIVGFRAMWYHQDELYPVLGPAFAQIGIDWDVQHRSTHPPACLLLVSPITFLQAPYQQWLWLFMVLAAYGLSFWAIGANPLTAAAGAVLVLLFTPAATSIANIVPFWLLAVCIAYRYRNGNTLVAGCWVGLGAAVKILPGVISALYLWRRNLRYFVGLVFALLATSLIALAIDSRIFAHYWVSGREASAYTIARIDNLGFLPWAYNNAGLLGFLAAIVFIIALVWVNRAHLFSTDPHIQPHTYWLMAYFAFLLLPIAWVYSFIVLIPVLIYFFLQRNAYTIGIAVLAVLMLQFMRPYNNPYLGLVSIVIGLGFFIKPAPSVLSTTA